MIRRRSVTPLPWDATWQDRTMAFWWRRVPSFFRLFSTNLGIAMRDGRYATAWRPVCQAETSDGCLVLALDLIEGSQARVLHTVRGVGWALRA